MGGNALSYTTVRLTKRVFDDLAAECLGKLSALYPGRRIATFPPFKGKYEFGDLDLLVEAPGFDPHAAAAALGAVEVVHEHPNAPNTSVGLVVRPELGACNGNVFQVDLVTIEPEAFDFCLAYFSYNDLPDLLRAVGYALGVALRHDGLFYYVQEGSYRFREVLLTRDFAMALRYMGYDPARHAQGFDTLTDVFQYAASSEFFSSALFLATETNCRTRRRARQRRTYGSFLAWLQEHPELPSGEVPADPGQQPAVHARLAEHFPHLAAERDAALRDLALQRAKRAKFSGERMQQLTGLQGPALGQLMTAVRAEFDGPEALCDFAAAASAAELDACVLAVKARLGL